jgi:hypothetical protein
LVYFMLKKIHVFSEVKITSIFGPPILLLAEECWQWTTPYRAASMMYVIFRVQRHPFAGLRLELCLSDNSLVLDDCRLSQS